MDLVLGRTTCASALSNVFNNKSKSNNGHCQSSNQKDLVICSLCPAVVLLNNATASSPQENSTKRSQMMKNLCNHMKISCSDIPSKCTTTSLPLCKTCEDRMNKLWKLQGVLDKVGLETSKIVKCVEKAALDDRFVNAVLKQQRSTFKSVTTLKDNILEGYRNKLRMTQPTFDGNHPVVTRVIESEGTQDAEGDVVIHGPPIPSSSSLTTTGEEEDDDDDEEEEEEEEPELVEAHSNVMWNVWHEEGGSRQGQEEIVISSDDDQITQEAFETQHLEADEEEGDIGNYFTSKLFALDLIQDGFNRNMDTIGVTKADYNEDELTQDQQVAAPANGRGTGSPPSVSQTNEHQRQPKRSNFTCSLCSVIFDTKDSLTEHENAQHKSHADKNTGCKARERGTRVEKLSKRKWGKNHQMSGFLKKSQDFNM